MKQKSGSESAFFSPRVLPSFGILFTGILLMFLSRVNSQGLASGNPVPPAPSGRVQQAWVARYDGSKGIDEPMATAIDSSGNVYVTGSTIEADNDVDSVTIKYDSAGQQQWVAIYNACLPQAIAVDRSGNVYVTGFSFGSGISSAYVILKYNPAGQEEWVAIYHNPADDYDEAVAIAVDWSGNVYVTGSSCSEHNNPDYATIKYDSAGKRQWVIRYDNGGIDSASAIAIDSSGNVYVTGISSVDEANTNLDYATIKYNPAGQELWIARYNGPGNNADGATALAVDDSGSAYVTGFSVGSGTGYDYATIKYNATGQRQWVARYNGPGNDSDLARSVAVDVSGNVYVTGQSVGAGTDYDYATIEYTGSGQERWVARYNGPGNSTDQATAVVVDNLGSAYVTGLSVGAETGYDYATIKYGGNGEEQWVTRYNGPGNGLDGADALTLDQLGNIYVTGISLGLGSNYDYATIKYVQDAIPTPTPTPTPTASPRQHPTPRLRPVLSSRP